jgi:hypothetical protein
LNKIFNCGLCESKEAYGCEKETECDLQFKPACFCKGLYEKCEICQGKGSFTFRRCPVNVLFNPSIKKFLPYFFEWENSGSFPDAAGRLFQPIKMLEAFFMCNVVSTECKMKERAAK